MSTTNPFDPPKQEEVSIGQVKESLAQLGELDQKELLIMLVINVQRMAEASEKQAEIARQMLDIQIDTTASANDLTRKAMSGELFKGLGLPGFEDE